MSWNQLVCLVVFQRKGMKMISKKFIALSLGALVLGLTSCGGSDADLTYWCPSVDADLMTELVAEFKASKPEYANLKIETAGYYGEGDVYAQLHKDLEAAADVMAIADDNIASAVTAEEIVAWTDEEKAAAIASDGAAAVESCSLEGTMYGLPYRADNAPMPMYDSTVYTSADQLASFESILATAKAAGKQVYLDLCNGWYNATLLTCGGATFTRQKNDKGVYEMYTDAADADKIDGVAASLEAFKSLYNSYKDTWVINSDNAKVEAEFESGKLAYVFLWNDLNNIRAVNENVKVGVWPTIKISGKDVQMKCFLGYKAYVCKENSDTERVALAKEFTKFLASKNAQVKRAAELKYGPSNLEAQADDAAKSLEFTAKIAEQAAMSATIGQAINTTGDFWTPMQNLGNIVTDGSEGWGDMGSAARVIQALVSNIGWTSTKA